MTNARQMRIDSRNRKPEATTEQLRTELARLQALRSEMSDLAGRALWSQVYQAPASSIVAQLRARGETADI